MKVVPVDTLDDALLYLEKNGREKINLSEKEVFYRNFAVVSS